MEFSTPFSIMSYPFKYDKPVTYKKPDGTPTFKPHQVKCGREGDHVILTTGVLAECSNFSFNVWAIIPAGTIVRLGQPETEKTIIITLVDKPQGIVCGNGQLGNRFEVSIHTINSSAVKVEKEST